MTLQRIPTLRKTRGIDLFIVNGKQTTMKLLTAIFLLPIILVMSCKKDNNTTAEIATISESNVTSNSITTGGNISSDGSTQINYRGIAWAMHANPNVGDSVTKEGKGAGSFNSTISHLNANTTYYLRAYAINGVGTAYGNELKVVTAKGLATIVTSPVTGIIPLSASSGGRISNDGGAPVTERGMVYSKNPNPTTADLKIVAGADTGSFSATLTPLASQEIYYVRAYAITSYGTAYGEQIQFKSASASTLSDIDGNIYIYVTLCGKDWMTSNLQTTKYKNGDPILNGSTGYTWSSNSSGAYAFPNGNAANKDGYGLLYNLPAIKDARGICPAGWHVPTDEEWAQLEICQGMTQAETEQYNVRGTIAPSLVEGGSSGLNLKKAGYLFNPDGSYKSFNSFGMFWSSTDVGPGNILRAVGVTPVSVYRTYTSGWTLSIRCVRD
jgi:uncharacterized protein (TIGR02145 family)